jgi:hypothetical protein
MARDIQINITTTANLAALNTLSGALVRLQRDLKSLTTTGAAFTKAFSGLSRGGSGITSLVKSTTALSKSTRLAVRDVAGLTTVLRNATRQASLMARGVDQNVTLNSRLAQAEGKLLRAQQQVNEAQREYTELIARGGGTQKEINAAAEKVRLANQNNEAVKRTVNSIKQETRAYQDAQKSLASMKKTIDSIEASGKQAPTQLLNTYDKLQNQVAEYQRTLGGAAKATTTLADADRRLLALNQTGLLTQRVNQVKRLSGALKDAMAQTAAYIGMIQKEEAAEKKLLQQQERAADKFIQDVNREYERAVVQQNREIARAAREREQAERTAARATQQAMRDSAQATQQYYTAVQRLMTPLRSFMTTLTSLSRLLSGTVRNALSVASGAVRAFTSTGAALFAGLQRAVQSTSSIFQRFSQTVQSSMNSATRSMQQFYNAGWSLLTTGYMMQNFGQGIFSGMAGSLTDYMNYEKALTRTAISAAGMYDAQGRPTSESGQPLARVDVNPAIIQDLIFGLQRGTYTESGEGIYQFNATELAEGLYFYTSAIGKTITDTNLEEVGRVVSSIMQMAAVTRTGLETATKGVINAALEFGIDPRDEANAAAIQNIAAQMGYLANISTMEVPDIAEAFKMVGPMAHILSPTGAGSGLNEMFTLTFLASEMGLRGGNVGRGINQALTTLLDPTEKALGIAAEAFGIEASQEAWNAFFFDSQGRLEGGIQGLFEKLATADADSQAQFLASLFTTNATRSVIAIQEAIAQRGGWDAVMQEIAIAGENPMRWLEEAALATNNTIFANMQNMKNAWFSVTAEIIKSIEGPLKSGLRFFADLFWNIGDAIRNNPWIGELLVGIASVVAAITTAIGTVLMFAGSILLLMKAFSMIGGLANPFLFFLLSSIKAFLILTPLVAGLAVLAGVLYSVWDMNLGGIQDRVEGLKKSFSFEGDVVPRIQAIGQAFMYTLSAFQQFTGGILVGLGDTSILGSWLEDVFGPLLGPFFYAQLLRLREGLSGLRSDIAGFFGDISAGSIANSFREALGAVRTFFEFFFTQRASNVVFDETTQRIANAAMRAREFVAEVITGFLRLRATLSPILQEIGNNLDMIFTRQNMMQGIQVFMAALQGIVTGLASVVILAARGFELLTRAIANAGNAGNELNGLLERLFGIRATVQDVARAIGVAIGTFLGARLIAAILPGVALFVRMIPLLVTLAAGFVRLGVQLTFIAAQFALVLVRALAVQVALVAQNVVLPALIGAYTGLTAIFGVFSALLASTATRVAQITVAKVAWGVASAVLGGTIAVLNIALGALAAILSIAMIGVVAIGGAMLIAAYQMGGWSAVWQGLIGIAEGFWSVARLVIGALIELGQWIATLIPDFSTAGLAADNFRAVGVALATVLLGLAGVAIASAVVSLGAFIVTTLTALGPIGALIAILGGLVVALAAVTLIDWNISGWVDTLATEFRRLYDVLSFSDAPLDDIMRIADLRIGQLFNNLMVSTLTHAGAFVTEMANLMSDISILGWTVEQSTGWSAGDWASGPIADAAVDYVKSYDDAQREIDAIYSGARVNKVRESIREAVSFWDDDSEKGIRGQAADMVSTIADVLDIPKILEAAGITDYTGDYTAESLIESFGFEKFNDMFAEELSRTGMTMDEVLRREYDTAKDRFDAWAELVAEHGPGEAARLWEASGMGSFPTNPGTYDEFLSDMRGQTSEAVKTIEQLNQEITQALTSMTLPDALKGMFGKDSLAGALGIVGEQLISNIGEAGPWLNLTELLADVAGVGMLDTDISGQNIHDALRPALEIVAQQTGMSINDILKDIPKYIVPQEFVPLATTEILEGLNSIPTELYKQLDTLGVGQFTEYGLDWAELVEYSVGQAVAGHDWNLADYISSSWGISINEANSYLASHGIDPNVISSAWMEDTEMLVASAGGQINLINEEWYGWLTEATQGFTQQVITLTEDQFAAIPDYIKIGFSNMGYTFVLANDTYSAEAVAAAQQSMNQIEAAYGSAQAWNKIGEAIRDGTVATMPAFDAAGNLLEGYVTLVNTVTGTTITLPAVEAQAYLESIRIAEGGTTRLQAIITAWTTMQGVMSSLGGFFGVDVDIPDLPTAPTTTTPRMPGVPSPAQIISQAQADANSYVTNVNSTMTNATFDTSMFTEFATDAANAFSTAFAPAFQAAINQSISGSQAYAPAGVEVRGPFDAVFEGYANSAANAFSKALSTAMAIKMAELGGGGQVADIAAGPFDGIFTAYANTAMQAFATQVPIAWGTQFDAGYTIPAERAGSSPFDSIFELYAVTAMGKFQTSLETEWALLPTYLSLEGGTSPFDNLFVQYGTSAGTVFKNAVNAALSGWAPTFGMPQADLAAPGAVAGAQATMPSAPQINVTIEVDTSQLEDARASLDTFAAIEWIALLNADNSLFMLNWQAATNAGFTFALFEWTSTLNGNNTSFFLAWQAAVNAGTAFDLMSFTADLFATNGSALSAIAAARNAAQNYARTYYATLAVNDYATGTVNNLINRLNVLDGTVATTTVTTVQQTVVTSPQRLAAGGTVHSATQMVGERGFEFAQLPTGSRVYSNSRSMIMLRDAVRSAMRDFSMPMNFDIEAALTPKEHVMPMSEAHFMNSPQWKAQAVKGQGDVKIEIDNLTIAKEVDIDRALERLDRLTGRKIELATRGMIAFDSARTM